MNFLRNFIDGVDQKTLVLAGCRDSSGRAGGILPLDLVQRMAAAAQMGNLCSSHPLFRRASVRHANKEVRNEKPYSHNRGGGVT
jgi:hypothetical protein